MGIDTPEGSYTYHYEDNYFSLFDCVELERGKHWDGHTEEDVTRLLSLERETCNDAISRQNATAQCFQAMELISGEFECELSPEQKSYNAGLRKAIEIIRALPPVTPKQKMGQWIVKSDKFVEWGVCSLCKENSYEPFAYAKRHFKYCPQCGSKMQEVKNNEIDN